MLLFSFSVLAENHNDDVYGDIGDVTLTEDAGLTPSSTFYFMETLLEDVFTGNDPEKALAVREEKIAEMKEMLADGKNEEAREALLRARKFSTIVESEVSPDIERRARESSKAVKEALEKVQVDDPILRDLVEDQLESEERVALAAKLSSEIKDLCERLSRLDYNEYGRVCKTDEDAPEWQRELDEKLTEEQREEAEKFFETLSECFEDPAECQCQEISVPAFAAKCEVIAPLAAKCEEGDEDACEEMDNVGDPVDLLPPHLQRAMRAVEDRFRDAEYDHHMPVECVREGATTKEACMRVMFKIHAPPECLEALDRGEIDPQNEREAREQCEKIMFNHDAPQECIDAGLTDRRECEKLMFSLDAPEECLDAGITGENRNDWKKCEVIRFKAEAPEECLDAGITGDNRNDWKKCEAIRFKMDAPQECLDQGLTGEGHDDWRQCDAIRFKLEAPQECLDAGIDPSDRRAWDKCKPIQFKAEVSQECLDAGLTGESQRDWRECQKIQFKLDAPQECLDAGITGDGRDDWRKCDEIRHEFESERHDENQFEDCATHEFYFCDDDGNCKCVNEEDYEKKFGYGDDDHGDQRCATIYCQEGTYCEAGECIPFEHDDDYEESQCKDGCSDECPGADRTDCVDNGMRCECYYDEHDDGGSDSGPLDDGSDGTSTDGSSDGTDSGTSDDGSSDSGSSEGSTSDDGSSDEGTRDSNTDSEDSGSSDSGSESSSSDSGSSDAGSSDSGSSDSGSDSGSSDDGGDSSDSGGEITGGGIVDVESDGPNPLVEFFKKFFGTA